MSLLFIDSFDNYTPLSTAVAIKWQALVASPAATFQIDTTNPRTAGGQDLYFGGTPADPVYLQKTFLSDIVTVVVGFAFRVDTFDNANNKSFIQFLDRNTGSQIMISITPLGFLSCNASTISGPQLAVTSQPAIVQSNVYYFLETKITFDGAAGAIKMNVTGNGVTTTLINATGLNTAPTGINSMRSLRIGSISATQPVPNSFQYHFDDFYVCDTLGAQNNDILGDCRAVCLFPNGSGASTQFSPVGAATNWQCVDELSEDGDTTYVFGSTIGNKDLYNHGPTPATTNQVLGAQLCGVMRKDDTGTRVGANTVLSGATAQDGSSNTLSLQYAGYLDILETDPATGVAFTKAGIDAMQIGAKIIS